MLACPVRARIRQPCRLLHLCILRSQCTETGAAERDQRNMASAFKDFPAGQDEQAKLQELRAALGNLTGRDEIYCTDACLRRYLRARHWNPRKAEKMLRESLKWRRHFKPEEITWEDIEHEGETAKMYKASFLDRTGRTVLIMCPGRQNTSDHDGQMRHLAYCLENAIISLPPDQEQMVWLIDFRGWTFRSSPPMRSSRETLNILQNHYPERLGLAILYNPPRIFETFWSLIKPFIDPVTFKKVRFVYSKAPESAKLMSEVFDLEELEEDLGGRKKLVYDHEAYAKLRKQDDVRQAQHWQLRDAEKDSDTAAKGAKVSAVVGDEAAPAAAALHCISANEAASEGGQFARPVDYSRLSGLPQASLAKSGMTGRRQAP
eukprot:SM000162S02352  [mRNA]  locus=s162:69289:71893:- [translate_table: standard]